MSNVINRFKLLIIIYITIVTGATYFSIYLPVKDTLKNNAFENYLHNIKTDDMIIQQFRIRCEDLTINLSNSYLLEIYLNDYIGGIITLEDLKTNTQSKYKERIGNMHNLKSAVRIVKNNIIATQGEVDWSEAITMGDKDYLTSKIDIKNQDIIFKVFSPIEINNNTVGYDILEFYMTDIINSVNRDVIKFNLLLSGNAKPSLYNNPVYSLDNMDLFTEGKYTVHIREIDGCDAYLYYKVANKVLFAAISKLTIIIFISCTVAIIVMVTLTNLLIVKSAGKVLANTEKSKEKYKEFAIRDTLSGAYSRRFFENWIEEQLADKDNAKNFKYTAVLLDVDRFKMINDSFGHIGGDKAIHSVSCVLLATVRTEDYVIRYGGDEFLILFKDCSDEQAESVMERVKEKIHDIDVINFDISISYGIQRIDSPKNIHEAVKMADEKMYAEKKKKNIISNN